MFLVTLSSVLFLNECIKKMEIQKSDCFLLSISNYVRLYLSRNEITIISMKNVAKNYCKNCTDSEIEFIYNYLDLANNSLNEIFTIKGIYNFMGAIPPVVFNS